MTEEDKTELFKHSETLKDHALKLFEGKGEVQPIYALVHAASQMIKQAVKQGEAEMSYGEAILKIFAILSHLENCSGCDEHKEAAGE